MKIEYNESENTIEIKDGLKNQYLILKILMILNLANALTRLIGQNKTGYGIIEYFWIAIGIVSIIALYFFLFKNSTAEKIKIGEIKRLNEKSVFGRKRFSLELDNGKKRILGNFKNEFELVEMRELFTRVGIPN
ncbi:hypothetical protein [Lacinutrix sp. Bg11-31]|uniref:hypothetical protein n=1 Tax=Lacinutrix sp. Bg11-31 TaxID=2057808 RepID=UPI000C319103|nr:hypothetical protein [Lacinutrix sp. Bg11-31]AUC80814.1 hypothetical protein CW733_01145 [Lacinutrix sp. Bg11-31]